MLHVKILHPDRLVFEGEAEYIIAPGAQGDLGIMQGHTRMYAELITGEIHIQGPEPQTLPIESGILRIKGDNVTILVGLE